MCDAFVRAGTGRRSLVAIVDHVRPEIRAGWGRGGDTMTPNTADRGPLPTVEDFEELASTAPETVRLEFVNGKIEVKAVPDGKHHEIIRWLMRVCMQHRPDLWLYPECGLKIEKYRKGRARPDGSLAPPMHFIDAGDWADPDGVLMAV